MKIKKFYIDHLSVITLYVRAWNFFWKKKEMIEIGVVGDFKEKTKHWLLWQPKLNTNLKNGEK